MSEQPGLALQFTYKRLHLPSGREYQGHFNASHDACFADPKHFSFAYLNRTMLELVNSWNRQQPTTWKYWL